MAQMLLLPRYFDRQILVDQVSPIPYEWFQWGYRLLT